MGRRASNRLFQEFVCSLAIGFITGYVTSNTVLLILRRRHDAACRAPFLSRHKHVTSGPATLEPEPFQKRLVFIGVMTTRKYLNSRADTIYKTWGKHVPGRLVFFVGTGEDLDTPLPVIALSDVTDDEYPPQRKSFEMLRYMAGQHGDDYHWFMRLDDDVYVNTNRLTTFLNSIDSSQYVYMGHPGTGKRGEKGHLGLHDDKPYCMGGPGIVLSAPTLKDVSPHLIGCLNDTASNHEDSELGRCIEKVTGQSCSQGKKISSLFVQSYSETSGVWTLGLKPQRLNSISFHPMKQSSYLYALHLYVLSKLVRDKMKHADTLRRETQLTSTSGFVSFDEPDVKNCWMTPCDPDDGRTWSCIKAYDVYSVNAADSENLKDSVLNKGRVFGLAEARHALGIFLKKEGVKKRLRLSPVSYQRISAGGLEHLIITVDGKSNFISFRCTQKFDPYYFREIPIRTKT